MRYKLIVGLALLALLAFAAVTVAQDADLPLITVKQNVPIMTTVEFTVDGQTYTAQVPATINIDTQLATDEANLTAPVTDRVGPFSWRISAIEETAEPLEIEYYSYEPGEGNKLVVVQSEVTNFSDQPLEPAYVSVVEPMAVDNAGNRYEIEDTICDTLNPGATTTCTIVLEVPATTAITGLDIEYTDTKRITFQP